MIVKNLTNVEKAYLHQLISKIEYPEDSYEDYISSLRVALSLCDELFKDVISLRNLGQSSEKAASVIWFKNLPQDQSLPKTPPGSSTLRRIPKTTWISENTLVLISLIFGEPYSMKCEGVGLINNLIPEATASHELTGVGTARDLELHIENAALRFLSRHNCSPKALLLSGLRQAKSAPPSTMIADFREAVKLVNSDDLSLLQEYAYALKLPYRWRWYKPGYESVSTEFVPLVERNGDSMVAHAAFYGDMLTETLSERHRSAANHFWQALKNVQKPCVINPGEILCIDNRVCFHARTAFKVQPVVTEQEGRWVQRLFVCEDLRCFEDWESNDGRVFSPTF